MREALGDLRSSAKSRRPGLHAPRPSVLLAQQDRCRSRRPSLRARPSRPPMERARRDVDQGRARRGCAACSARPIDSPPAGCRRCRRRVASLVERSASGPGTAFAWIDGEETLEGVNRALTARWPQKRRRGGRKFRRPNCLRASSSRAHGRCCRHAPSRETPAARPLLSRTVHDVRQWYRDPRRSARPGPRRSANATSNDSAAPGRRPCARSRVRRARHDRPNQKWPAVGESPRAAQAFVSIVGAWPNSPAPSSASPAAAAQEVLLGCGGERGSGEPFLKPTPRMRRRRGHMSTSRQAEARAGCHLRPSPMARA